MNFKERRKELGLTLEEVGKLCKVGKSTVLKWERGDIANMKRDKIALYAKALKISPIEVLDPQHELDGNALDITEIFNKLDGTRKQRTYNFARQQLDEQSNGKIVAMPNAEVVNIIPVKNIEVYDTPVSAGYGEDFLDDHHEDVEYRGHIPNDYDFALRVRGNSMEPAYHNKQIVFVKKTEVAYDGQVVIAVLNGNAYIKELSRKDGEIELISYNKYYKPIKINKDDDFRVWGIVLN